METGLHQHKYTLIKVFYRYFNQYEHLNLTEKEGNEIVLGDFYRNCLSLQILLIIF